MAAISAVAELQTRGARALSQGPLGCSAQHAAQQQHHHQAHEHQGLWLAASDDVLVGRSDNGCTWVWDLAAVLGWADGRGLGWWEALEDVSFACVRGGLLLGHLEARPSCARRARRVVCFCRCRRGWPPLWGRADGRAAWAGLRRAGTRSLPSASSPVAAPCPCWRCPARAWSGGALRAVRRRRPGALGAPPLRPLRPTVWEAHPPTAEAGAR